MAGLRQIIEDKLREALAPSLLEVEDFSARHAGHAGAREGGESHFHIRIASTRFAGLSRVEQHRLVYSLLAQELQNGLHALSLETNTGV